MGTASGGDDDERPVHEVTLSSYYMDRTEVTVSAYGECVRAGRCAARSAVDWPGISAADRTFYSQYCNWGVSGREAHPMNCVSWDDAVAYCGWRGGRLPTEAEWEYGARGSDGRVYPWGNEGPSDRRLQWSGGCGGFGCSGGTAAVGSHASGRSPFGLEDMSGNVWEWVSDWYGAYPSGAVRDPSGPTSGDGRVLRGGSWLYSDAAGVRSANRFWYEASNRNVNVGFRCARGAN
ncbi:MAG: SUMF1/EgtB/PvdO family nonheme iron enzyme [Sandaracinaceae bacterium]|nr:SUMF1/EgtB/PvdO family nonheme iron enzyme [Sandaracinaceae bacterium]